MPKGRMLNKKISQDDRVAKLSIEATLLYTWCIPYLDIKGRMYGDVWTLKSIVPHVEKITPKNIPEIITEWVAAGLVIHYGDTIHKYLEFKGFRNNQKLNPDKEAESEIPTPDLLQSNSGVTPPKVKISKVNTIEDKSGVFPFLKDELFKTTYGAFLDMRKKMGKTPTDHAEYLLLKELHKDAVNVAIKRLEQSLVNGWQGIFPLKQQPQGGTQWKKP